MTRVGRQPYVPSWPAWHTFSDSWREIIGLCPGLALVVLPNPRWSCTKPFRMKAHSACHLPLFTLERRLWGLFSGADGGLLLGSSRLRWLCCGHEVYPLLAELQPLYVGGGLCGWGSEKEDKLLAFGCWCERSTWFTCVLCHRPLNQNMLLFFCGAQLPGNRFSHCPATAWPSLRWRSPRMDAFCSPFLEIAPGPYGDEETLTQIQVSIPPLLPYSSLFPHRQAVKLRSVFWEKKDK